MNSSDTRLFARKNRPAVGLILIVLAIAAASLLVREAVAAPQPVAGGYADWGFKESFRDYITGTIAQGQITLAGGATQNPDGAFRFPAKVTGSYDTAAGTASSAFDGSVRFTGHAGALDTTISDVRINIAGSSGMLIADVVSRSLDDGQMHNYSDVDLAELDATGITPVVSLASATWPSIPSTLTEDGAPAFSGFYDPGTELDPVTFSLCVALVNHWPVPAGDADCDGFPSTLPIAPPNATASETELDTITTIMCASTPERNDENTTDRWPVDMDDNQLANGSDLLTFAPVFGSIGPGLPYQARWDLNGDDRINGSDLLKVAPFFGKKCV